MLKNYFKIAVRSLLRNKLYMFINIFGLSLGIACCILILLFIRNEWTYDAFHENSASIYRVLTNSKGPDGDFEISAYVPMPLAPALRTEIPEVLHAARFSTGETILSSGNKVFSERVLFTDPDVLSMFNIQFVHGNPSTALNNPNGIILTESMAQKYFGSEDPVGKPLGMQTRVSIEPLTVAGVVRSMPSNSSLKFDFLANIMKHQMYTRGKDRWTSSNGSAFVQLAHGSSMNDVEAKLKTITKKYYADIIKRKVERGVLSKEENSFKLQLQSLRDIHLDTQVRDSPEEKGNPTYSYILGAVALFVLLIACINFTTLAIGRSVDRAREVGMRKVLGAVRRQLMYQFLGEAFLLCFVSLMLGLALVEICLPMFNLLADKQLSLDVISDPFLLPGMAALLLLVGCIAGGYPAFIISRFAPAEILKGKNKTGGRGYFMKSLIIFQFSLSIFLIAGAILMSRQLNYLLTKDLGYDASQVVTFPVFEGNDIVKAQEVVDRLRSRVSGNPAIVSVSVTNGAFTKGYDNNGYQYHGVNKNAFVYRVDEQFLHTLGMQLKEGRNFVNGSASDHKNGMIVNEAFVRDIGWTEPVVGKQLTGTDSKDFEGMEVIGVVKDFNFRSLHEEVKPAMLFEKDDWYLDDILVRISPANIPATIEYLRNTWKEIAPNKPFDISFLDFDVQQQYEAEMKWGTIVKYSSTFAVSLACLGLFGLAALSVINRTKEIGVRKVLGASVTAVVGLLAKDFLKLVLIANIVAWPAAYFALDKYLQSYPYRVHLGLEVFLFAGGLAFFIAAVTISIQVTRAALSDPVKALRYE